MIVDSFKQISETGNREVSSVGILQINTSWNDFPSKEYRSQPVLETGAILTTRRLYGSSIG